MHRFFLPLQSFDSNGIVDLKTLHHQLTRVLRMNSGDTLLLLTGDGYEYLVQLQNVDEKIATGIVLEKRLSMREPSVQLTLFQCALKGPKLEWVLQKGTELGVRRFVPVMSERTIVRPLTALTRKYDRWQSILREAAEQSGRGRLPELADAMTWEEAVGTNRLQGSTEAIRFVPWEQSDGLPSLGKAIDQLSVEQKKPMEVGLLIGPEGGITAMEIQAAVACGWQPVSLGPRILRAETAAIAATSIIMNAFGEMG